MDARLTGVRMPAIGAVPAAGTATDRQGAGPCAGLRGAAGSHRLPPVLQALWALLPPGVGAAALPLDGAQPPWTALPPEEARCVQDAVPARQRAFAAGRRCARLALAQLAQFAAPAPGADSTVDASADPGADPGADPLAAPVPDPVAEPVADDPSHEAAQDPAAAAADVGPALGVGPQRAPRWPPGRVGSISHDPGWACAVAGLDTQFDGLGLDIERADRVHAGLVELLCTPEERRLHGLDGGLPAGQALPVLARLFSAKEALYKALQPRLGGWIGFDAVTLRRLPTGADAGPFEAVLCAPLGPWPAGQVLHGLSALVDGRVAAFVALPAGSLGRR